MIVTRPNNVGEKILNAPSGPITILIRKRNARPHDLMTSHAEVCALDLTLSHSRTPLFSLLLVALGLSGCQIDFEAETVVEPDGTVTRTSHHVADAADRDELETSYTLPSGGTWTTQTTMRYNEAAKKDTEVTRHTYSVTKRYRAGDMIPPDHVRRGKTEGRVVRNDMSVSVQDQFFVKTFQFREAFRDVGGKELALAAANRLYPTWVERFAEILERRLDGVDAVQTREAIRDIADPWFERLIEALQAGDRALVESYVEELNEVLEKDYLVSELMVRLPPPSPDQTASWREALTAAYEEMEQSSPGLWEDKEVEEALFGVYGFTLFQSYGFRETVSLPGVILSTNATSRQGNVLIWEWDSPDFALQDHVLEAQSRLIYPIRIAWAGIVVLVLLGTGGVFLRRRRRQA